MNRQEYIQLYKDLGDKMFSNCVIPTVFDFANATVNRNKKAQAKIDVLTNYTGKKVDDSLSRRTCNYSEDESKKYMQSVIAANISDITDSGFFYKKLISSADDMLIVTDDCGSEGIELELPVTEEIFNYKIKYRWVNELNKYVEDFSEIEKLKKKSIHVRNAVECKNSFKRCFCKKCMGLFRRSYDTEFTPKYIGLYSTLMITEKATQASLDSMNKGVAEKLNVILERKIEPAPHNIDEAKEAIYNIINEIGWTAHIESRFYEIAMLSRWRNNKFEQLISSFTKQEDKLGAYISKDSTFKDLILAKEFKANTAKTRLAFDIYDDEVRENGNRN